MSEKKKIGLYWAASCGGCEIAVLELHEKILDLLEVADIVFWPCVMDFKYKDLEAMPDGTIDICLFNGAIRNEENEHIARLLREKSKIMVAFGSCAVAGGIPGLSNLNTREDMFERSYRTTESTESTGIVPCLETDLGKGKTVDLPKIYSKVKTLNQVVKVDYFMPGCPPAEKQVQAVVAAITANDLPAAGSTIGAGEKSVCDECLLEKNSTRIRQFKRFHEIIPDGKTCLIEQGVICMGPATRSGCEARCPAAGVPCRGCYGPAGDTVDQGAKIISVIGSLIDSEDETEIREAAGRIPDPAGTFYRFGLPGSILGRSKK